MSHDPDDDAGGAVMRPAQALDESRGALAVVAVVGVPEDEALGPGDGCPLATYQAAREKLEGARDRVAEEVDKCRSAPAMRDFPVLVETPHDDLDVARGNMLVALRVVLDIIRPHKVPQVGHTGRIVHISIRAVALS
jgi:hypothetical protein